MDTNTTTPTLDEVKDLLPNKTYLTYVDYRDNLDNQLELIQKCIHKGNADALYEGLDEWFMDNNWGSYQHYLKELKEDLEKRYDEDVVEMFLEEQEDAIRDITYDRDASTPLKDLLRNTSDVVMFYNTGHEVECGYPMSEAKFRLERYKIKKLLGINTGEYDEILGEMLDNSGYGGMLYIYFTAGVDEFLDIDEDRNAIRFYGYVNIGCINSHNGSGHSVEFKTDFTIPFNKKNLWIDKCTTYNYTDDICGMSRDWCSSTCFELLHVEDAPEAGVDESMHRHLAQQAEYDKVYREGGCSTGDLNIRRHRNVAYHNDPMYCRNECPHCSTVWID